MAVPAEVAAVAVPAEAVPAEVPAEAVPAEVPAGAVPARVLAEVPGGTLAEAAVTSLRATSSPPACTNFLSTLSIRE